MLYGSLTKIGCLEHLFAPSAPAESIHCFPIVLAQALVIALHACTAKNDLLFWQLYLSPELQLWHGLRDDTSLVPCGNHLWAMQPLWSTATIEICPYKYPCQGRIQDFVQGGSAQNSDFLLIIHNYVTALPAGSWESLLRRFVAMSIDSCKAVWERG